MPPVDEDTYKIAKKLSKDKPPKRFFPGGGYLIYAHGTEWYFEGFIGMKLIWLPRKSVVGEARTVESIHSVALTDKDRAKAIKDTKPEYQSTWLPRHRMYRDIKWIIKNHPNLKYK